MSGYMSDRMSEYMPCKESVRQNATCLNELPKRVSTNMSVKVKMAKCHQECQIKMGLQLRIHHQRQLVGQISNRMSVGRGHSKKALFVPVQLCTFKDAVLAAAKTCSGWELGVPFFFQVFILSLHAQIAHAGIKQQNVQHHNIRFMRNKK